MMTDAIFVKNILLYFDAGAKLISSSAVKQQQWSIAHD